MGATASGRDVLEELARLGDLDQWPGRAEAQAADTLDGDVAGVRGQLGEVRRDVAGAAADAAGGLADARRGARPGAGWRRW